MVTVLLALGCVAVLAACAVGMWARISSGNEAAARKRRQRYCTKHKLVTMIPGGPERLVWVYGRHRTRGNECDGPEHYRGNGWW